MVRAQMQDAVEKQQFGRAEMLKRLAATIAGRQLYGFLASRNVLPKYGFPVDVVELNLARTGDAAALNLELHEIEACDRRVRARLAHHSREGDWGEPGRLVRPNRELRKYQWIVCGDCGAARHRLVEVSEECTVCSSREVARQGRFVIPEFGFVGRREEGRPGESRPLRGTSIESHFGVYQKESPDFEAVDSFTSGVQCRHFRQGRITVINRGPGGRGFSICEWCGYGEPAPAAHKKGKEKKHSDLRRPGRECQGHTTFLHLGHEYLTDVVEIAVPGLQNEPIAARPLCPP